MGNTLLYVKNIKNGKVTYSYVAKDAKRFSLPKALFSSLKFGLSWIRDKYIRTN